MPLTRQRRASARQEARGLVHWLDLRALHCLRRVSLWVDFTAGGIAGKHGTLRLTGVAIAGRSFQPQLDQVTTIAAQVPRHLRTLSLQRLAELLPHDYGDADVWRCAHRAVQEVLTAR